MSNAEGRDEAIYRSSARDARLADLEVAGACLHRLEYKGWIKADWGVSENNRRAKFYSLTRAGKKQLQAEMEDWNRLTNAIALVLERV